jgi:hypothetical protein
MNEISENILKLSARSIPFALTSLLLLSICHFATTTNGGETRPPSDTKDFVVRVDIAVARAQYINIVSFQSAYMDGFAADKNGKASTQPVHVPKTAGIMDDKRRKATAFHIEGEFALVETITGDGMPTLGLVNEDVAIESRWPDENFLNLTDLMRHIPESEIPRYFLMSGKGHPKSPLTATFIGPIPKADVRQVVELVRYLQKKPLSQITNEDAELLSKSENPLLQAAAEARKVEKN